MGRRDREDEGIGQNKKLAGFMAGILTMAMQFPLLHSPEAVMSQHDPVIRKTVEVTTYPLTEHLVKTCPACGDPLDIDQPDQAKPDRLLAVCCQCSAWYVVDAMAGVMTLIPA